MNSLAVSKRTFGMASGFIWIPAVMVLFVRVLWGSDTSVGMVNAKMIYCYCEHLQAKAGNIAFSKLNSSNASVINFSMGM